MANNSSLVTTKVVEHTNEPFFTITSESSLTKIMLTLPKTFDLPSYKYDLAKRFVTVEPTDDNKKMFIIDFRKDHKKILEDLEIPFELSKKQTKVKGGRMYFDSDTNEFIYSFESSYFGECDHFEVMSITSPFLMQYLNGVTFKAMKCDDFIMQYDGKLI
jgi:hypothetical protein